MPRVLDIDGFEWEVKALPETTPHPGSARWSFAKIRFEPVGHDDSPPREAWLMLEENVPARDVLDQYNDDFLTETFLVAQEVDEAGA